jgi:hypothetical protein
MHFSGAWESLGISGRCVGIVLGIACFEAWMDNGWIDRHGIGMDISV